MSVVQSISTAEAQIADFVGLLKARTRSADRTSGVWYIARAPGRLDVMGGIADYSGSLVLEATIGAGTVAAVSVDDRKTDSPFLYIHSRSLSDSGMRPEVDIPLKDCIVPDPSGYPVVRKKLRSNPETAWCALAAGCLTVLSARMNVRPESSINILIDSDVPFGAGVSSSAALEVAVMLALSSAFGIEIPGDRLAELCQEVENQIGGAPCGIMDQMTSALGHPHSLLRLRCNPKTVEGNVDLPDGVCVFGIDSGVKHSVAGSRYGRTRIGAFIAVSILSANGVDIPEGYLCNLTRREYNKYRRLIPLSMTGAEFRAMGLEYPDRATTVSDDHTYYPRSAAEHAVYENCRVHRFAKLLSCGEHDQDDLEEAGALMYASHWSYGNRALLGCSETDLLVKLLREAGPSQGVMGAKITGGGCGGTVAVLSTVDPENLKNNILKPYHRQTGLQPAIISGSSPGAMQVGVHKVELK